MDIPLLDDSPLYNWAILIEDDLRQYAAQYVGWATNEMGDPEALGWRLENQFPVSEFHNVATDWEDYFRDDVVNNPRYDENFIKSEFHTPVVVSFENDELIIWDGWHRIACAVARGDECIMAIVGQATGKENA